MAELLTARLLTPQRPLADGPADQLVAPAAAGQITVLPLHAPLIAELGPGVVEVRRGSEVEAFFVTGGFIEVAGSCASVLAEAAEPVGDIDVARARADLTAAEADLAQSDGAEAPHADRMARAERARQRLAAARPPA